MDTTKYTLKIDNKKHEDIDQTDQYILLVLDRNGSFKNRICPNAEYQHQQKGLLKGISKPTLFGNNKTYRESIAIYFAITIGLVSFMSTPSLLEDIYQEDTIIIIQFLAFALCLAMIAGLSLNFSNETYKKSKITTFGNYISFISFILLFVMIGVVAVEKTFHINTTPSPSINTSLNIIEEQLKNIRLLRGNFEINNQKNCNGLYNLEKL